VDPLNRGQANAGELQNLRAVTWGDAGNSTLRLCTYRNQSYLFKEYSTDFRAEVDDRALGELIRWREGLPPDDRDELDRVAAWPRFQVRDGEALVGVLVPPAPPAFYARTISGEGSRPRSMDYLIRFSTGAGEVRGASVPDKKRAIGNAVAVLLWFHRQNVRVNDVRESNILCTADGRAVLYVDCDVMMGPWGAVSSGAAPEYLAALLRHQPDPFDFPTREVELARVAWLATFVLLDDFRLRDVPADRLARHIGTADAELLRRTARIEAVDIDDWRELAEDWTDPRAVAIASVPRLPTGPVQENPTGWVPRSLRQASAPAHFESDIAWARSYQRVSRSWLLVAIIAALVTAILIATLFAGGL